jgi:hypothetical protein
MTRMAVALFNYERGGMRADGGYNFGPLQHAFSNVDEPPALVLFCEAKRYRDNGNAGLCGAAEALADELGRPYVGVLGWLDRGPMPPAIFWDPNVLTLRTWCGPDDRDVHDDQRNVARFALRGSGPERRVRTEFLAIVAHFSFRSGLVRQHEAQMLGRYGGDRLPVILGGDLNSTASGPHLPTCQWTNAPYYQRTHKGIRAADGTWGPDTAAVDHLIGRWDPAQQQRVDGCGFHALAELCPTRPIIPTVNKGIDPGGELHIDWLLANAAMLPHVIPGSYRVHVPPDGQAYPSDHRLVTATLDLPETVT